MGCGSVEVELLYRVEERGEEKRLRSDWFTAMADFAIYTRPLLVPKRPGRPPRTCMTEFHPETRQRNAPATEGAIKGCLGGSSFSQISMIHEYTTFVVVAVFAAVCAGD